MKKEKVSEAVIRRLPKYYRYLKELERIGVERISSQELSKKMGIKATQIRQDLNCFGGFGQQGYGYHVKMLKKEIKDIIGLNREYKVILVGAGNIGQALANYMGFEKEGFNIIGIFDVNPKLIGNTIRNKTIMDIDSLHVFAKENHVDLCIITTPKENAQEIADMVIGVGIKSIWNFAPVDVDARRGVCIENVHLNDSLYTLIYRMNDNERDDQQA
ncbi:MAG: redox-sensing transcriptional repressor Rex [Bacillota bacterium]